MGLADFQAYGSNPSYSRFRIILVIGLEKSVLIPIKTQLPSCGKVWKTIQFFELIFSVNWRAWFQLKSCSYLCFVSAYYLFVIPVLLVLDSVRSDLLIFKALIQEPVVLWEHRQGVCMYRKCIQWKWFLHGVLVLVCFLSRLKELVNVISVWMFCFHASSMGMSIQL